MAIDLKASEALKIYNSNNVAGGNYTAKKEEIADAIFNQYQNTELEYYNETTGQVVTKKYTKEEIEKIVSFIDKDGDQTISAQEMQFLNDKIAKGAGKDAGQLQNIGLGQKILDFFMGKFGVGIEKDNEAISKKADFAEKSGAKVEKWNDYSKEDLSFLEDTTPLADKIAKCSNDEEKNKLKQEYFNMAVKFGVTAFDYDKADTNKDGKVSVEELATANGYVKMTEEKKAEWQKLFNNNDKGGDGDIFDDIFRSKMGKYSTDDPKYNEYVKETEKYIENLKKSVDKDGDGRFSVEEYALYKGDNSYYAEKILNTYKAIDEAGNGDGFISKEELGNVIAYDDTFDEKQDGKITHQSFVSFLDSLVTLKEEDRNNVKEKLKGSYNNLKSGGYFN